MMRSAIRLSTGDELTLDWQHRHAVHVVSLSTRAAALTRGNSATFYVSNLTRLAKMNPLKAPQIEPGVVRPATG